MEVFSVEYALLAMQSALLGEVTAELLFVDVALFNGFPTAISQR